MADWSQLPKDLLQLISERLNDSPLYLIRFRSVCSTWRSSIPKPNHHPHHRLPFKVPPLSDDDSDSNDDDDTSTTTTTSSSLYKRSLFLITPPPHQQTLHLRPWLIKIGQDSLGRTRLWDPLSRDIPLYPDSAHVLDFNQLRVFDLGPQFVLADFSLGNPLSMEKLVLAPWQGDKEDGSGFVLLTIHQCMELALFRSGDAQWTLISNMLPWYSDVCVFKGRPCAVNNPGLTVTVGPDLSVDLLAEPVFGGGEKLLVESEGELLLVDMYFEDYRPELEYEHSFSWKNVVRIDVFKLEEKEKKWVQLTTLGDRILFLGTKLAFSASASDLCVGKGNCVIFHDQSGRHIFHLDEGRISPLCDYPAYTKLFWPPPDWVGLL